MEALLAAAFFTSTWDLVLKLDAAGFTFKLYQGLFLVLFALLSFKAWKKGGVEECVRPLRHPFALFMLGLGLYAMGLAPWSAFPLKSFLYSCWLIFDVLAVWMSFQRIGRHPRVYEVIWASLLFLSVIILIDAVAYHFGSHGGLIGFNQETVTNLGTSRPHGFTSEPSYAAAFLCLGLFTAGLPIFYASRRRWLAGCGVALILSALIATASRTGWICLLFGFLLLSFMPLLKGRKVHWKMVSGVAIVIPILAGLFYLLTPQTQLDNINSIYIQPLFSGKDSSGRLHAHKLAVQMAGNTYLLGVGMGASYRYFIDHGGIDVAYGDRGFQQEMYGNELIMSTWGQMIGEDGIPGLLLFFLAGAVLIRSLFRKWKQDDKVLGALVGAIVSFMFLLFWIGNVCRGDMWIWYGVWSVLAQPKA